MLALWFPAVVAATVLLAPAALADPDLDRIPQSAAPLPLDDVAPLSSGRVVYLQTDLSLSALRNGLVIPLPPPAPPGWEARGFVDARTRWRLTDNVSLIYSGRLNLRAEDGLAFPSHKDVRHDFREGYIAWAGDNGTFLDFGRINLKSGVAMGFNPTDVFKTRAVVEADSADPSVLREDRLGTLMFRAQQDWDGGAVTFALAPKIADETAPYLNTNLPSFNPMFDRTNAHTRALLKASFHLLDDVSPEVLAYTEDGETRYGLNVTKAVGQAVVVYLEWSGGDRASLVHDAIADGQETGVLPPVAPIPENAARAFQNDLALGASYATQSELTINLEYEYHQAGFSSADWRNWFGAGSNLAIDSELWFIRGYAADQQEPVARSSVFLRADWQDAFTHDLELAGFVDSDARDGSGFVQFTADYYLSRSWTVGVLGAATFGGHRSDFGSLPTGSTVLFKLRRYL
jgi:hypothetical protein